MRKKSESRRIIPENMGNRLFSIWPFILLVILNAALHVTILFVYYGFSIYSFFRVFFSFVFFIYPLYLMVDALWSLRPSVCRILSCPDCSK